MWIETLKILNMLINLGLAYAQVGKYLIFTKDYTDTNELLRLEFSSVEKCRQIFNFMSTYVIKNK